jgi:hypothetical protein
VEPFGVDIAEHGLGTKMTFGVSFSKEEGLSRGVRLSEGKGLLGGSEKLANKGVDGVLKCLWLSGREGVAVPGKGDFPGRRRTGIRGRGEEVEGVGSMGQDSRGCDRPLFEEVQVGSLP